MSEEEVYQLGPDSERQDGVAQGVLTHHVWESQIFEDTHRDYWVYVPAQYDPALGAALMVFQDGHTYIKEEGNFRVPIVLYNLIAQGAMPATIGLFINPGHEGDTSSLLAPAIAVLNTTPSATSTRAFSSRR
jgi:enterochelin esterase-like enzyme